MRGIATTSALAILAELAVLPPGMSARQWVAHAGLDPRRMESGTSLHQPTRISKKGNRHLRAALYMPALVSSQREPNIHGFYQRRIAGGLKPIQAPWSPSSESCSTRSTACGPITPTSMERSFSQWWLDEEERI